MEVGDDNIALLRPELRGTIHGCHDLPRHATKSLVTGHWSLVTSRSLVTPVSYVPRIQMSHISDRNRGHPTTPSGTTQAVFSGKKWQEKRTVSICYKSATNTETDLKGRDRFRDRSQIT